MAGKRYYWLKLQDGFFDSKRIKKLRRLAGGDTYTIIYLKMQLLAMKSGGILEYTGLEQSFAEELALDLDESPDNVSVTVNYLLSCGLLETSDQREYFVPYAVLNTGSESASTQRVRDHRARKVLHCNADETEVKRIGNAEKEIEIEKEIEKEIESKETPAALPSPKRKTFKKPSLEDIQAYCKESGYHVDAERFMNYYDSNGWMVGRNKMKDWKATVRNWASKERGEGKSGHSGNPGESKDYGIYL